MAIIGGEAAVNILGSRAVSLLPFGYFAVTRVSSLRDLAYLVATSWLPAIWLIARLAGLDNIQSVMTFLIGYMAFISAYEIGYLVNDAWDARRSGEGRARLSFHLDRAYVVAFLAIRLGLWAGIGVLTNWIANPLWLAGYAALAIAFAQHNLVHLKDLRLASFYELATLRFMLPILASIPVGALPPALLVALILYAFPRFLAYAESKDLLNLDKRRAPSFGFLLLLSFSPLVLYFSYLLDAEILVELLAYYLAIHALWWALSNLRKFRTR
jgi:hypothetical protein